MYTEVDEPIHISFSHDLGEGPQYRLKHNPRSFPATWLHNPTVLPPQDEEERPSRSSLPPAGPMKNTKEGSRKRRSRVDSGVSVSSPSNIFKSSYPRRSNSPAVLGDGTATAKSSAWSMAVVSASSASTAPSDIKPKSPSPIISNKANSQGISVEARLTRFRRESQASHKSIDDKIKAHREKERARNGRAEEMLRTTNQHKKMTEKRLKQAVRENKMMDQGTRARRIKRWVSDLFFGPKSRKRSISSVFF